MVEKSETETSTRGVVAEQANLLSQKQQPISNMLDTKGLDVVKQCYGLFAKKDIDAILQNFAEDAIIEVFTAENIPFGGTGRSRDYMKNHYFGKMLAKYDFKEFKHDQFEYFVGLKGDKRTVHTHVLGKGYLKDDKRPFIVNSSHTFEFNDNLKITRYHEVCVINLKQWE